MANNAINRIITYVVCSSYLFRIIQDPCKSEAEESIIHDNNNIRPWSLTPGTTSYLNFVVK